VESFAASHKMPLEFIFSKGKEKKPRKADFLTGEWRNESLPQSPTDSSKKLIKVDDSGRVESFASLPQSPLGNLFERKKKASKGKFLYRRVEE
jgi:hypothetical protein